MGQLDRVYTIWRHSGGYADVDKTELQLSKMMDYQKFVEQQGKLLQKREQQLCYEFAFWPTYDDYFDGGIFEIRSYSLKVGKAFHLKPVSCFSNMVIVCALPNYGTHFCEPFY